MARTMVDHTGGRPGTKRTLHQVLLDRGYVTPEQLDRAQAEKTRTKKNLGRILLELGYVTDAQLTEVLAVILGHEFVDLSNYPLDPTAASLLPDGLTRIAR